MIVVGKYSVLCLEILHVEVLIANTRACTGITGSTGNSGATGTTGNSGESQNASLRFEGRCHQCDLLAIASSVNHTRNNATLPLMGRQCRQYRRHRRYRRNWYHGRLRCCPSILKIESDILFGYHCVHQAWPNANRHSASCERTPLGLLGGTWESCTIEANGGLS